MGASKRLLEELQQQESIKQAALLELPEKYAEAFELLDKFKNELENSTVKIDELQKALIDANSLKSKFKDYCIGGIIGAFFGLICSFIF